MEAPFCPSEERVQDVWHGCVWDVLWLLFRHVGQFRVSRLRLRTQSLTRLFVVVWQGTLFVLVRNNVIEGPDVAKWLDPQHNRLLRTVTSTPIHVPRIVEDYIVAWLVRARGVSVVPLGAASGSQTQTARVRRSQRPRSLPGWC